MRRLLNSSSVAHFARSETVTLQHSCGRILCAVDRFKVFGDGDFLLVPVEINSNTYSFIVDKVALPQLSMNRMISRCSKSNQAICNAERLGKFRLDYSSFQLRK